MGACSFIVIKLSMSPHVKKKTCSLTAKLYESMAPLLGAIFLKFILS